MKEIKALLALIEEYRDGEKEKGMRITKFSLKVVLLLIVKYCVSLLLHVDICHVC